jgi:fructose-specific phosphotransferase system IIC component
MNTLYFLAVIPPLHNLLIGFLILVLILAVVGGLIYCIEAWVHPIPPPIKLVLAIVLVVLILIWAVNLMGGGQ